MKNFAFTILLFSYYEIAAQAGLIWAKQFIGTGADQPSCIKTDVQGNVYSCGYFTRITDFDPGSGVDTASTNYSKAYISKLDASGNFVWVKTFDKGTSGTAIGFDAASNLYLLGHFNFTADFDPGPGTFTMTPISGSDIFILKLDPAGNFLWVRQIGGAWFQSATALAVEGNGNNYITGEFSASVDFDPGPSVYNVTHSAGSPIDAFVLKLDASGNFKWVRTFVDGASQGNSIAIDSQGNVVSVGMYSGNPDMDPGPASYTIQAYGNHDAYISKLDSMGNFIWAGGVGGGSSDYVYGLTIDQGDNIYAGGWFVPAGADFDPGPSTYSLGTYYYTSGFILKLDVNGNFQWAKSFDSNYGANWVNALDIDNQNNLYVTGQFYQSGDFNPGPGIDSLYSNGDYDIFVVKLDFKGNYTCGAAMGGPTKDVGVAVAFDNFKNILETGYFSGTSDFDPGQNVYNMTSAAAPGTYQQSNIFLAKLTCGVFTNVNTTEDGEEFKIYPNPASRNINISLKEFCLSSLRIINAMGVLVKEMHLKETEKVISVDISDLYSGIYFVELSNSSGTSRRKIIIE